MNPPKEKPATSHKPTCGICGAQIYFDVGADTWKHRNSRFETAVHGSPDHAARPVTLK